MAASDFVRRHKADIVPVVRVRRAGVAETCEDQHGSAPWPEALFLGGSRRGSSFRLFGFRLHGRGRGDRGDREVTIGDHRLHAGRQLDRRNVDRGADVQAVEVDGDELGDRVGGQWNSTS